MQVFKSRGQNLDQGEFIVQLEEALKTKSPSPMIQQNYGAASATQNYGSPAPMNQQQR